MRIRESLHFQYRSYKDRVSFSDYIMSYQVKNPGEQCIHYNIDNLKKSQFEILYDIIEHFTLVQLMDSLLKFQSCSEYIRLLYIWLQLQQGSSVDTIFIESHMIPFGIRRNAWNIWNSVSHSQIHQQHR